MRIQLAVVFLCAGLSSSAAARAPGQDVAEQGECLPPEAGSSDPGAISEPWRECQCERVVEGVLQALIAAGIPETCEPGQQVCIENIIPRVEDACMGAGPVD